MIISTDMSSFISDWLTEAGLNLLGEIKEGGKDLILKRLGLKEFFSGPKCNPRHKPYSPSVQGWNNGIVYVFLKQFNLQIICSIFSTIIIGIVFIGEAKGRTCMYLISQPRVFLDSSVEY